MKLPLHAKTGPQKTSGSAFSEMKAPGPDRGRSPGPQLSVLEVLLRVTGAGPSTASIYCLQIFFFAFLMKLSIFIMVLAITGMCCEAALKASDKEKTCALLFLSPSLESVTSDKVGHSDLYRV